MWPLEARTQLVLGGVGWGQRWVCWGHHSKGTGREALLVTMTPSAIITTILVTLLPSPPTSAVPVSCAVHIPATTPSVVTALPTLFSCLQVWCPFSSTLGCSRAGLNLPSPWLGAEDGGRRGGRVHTHFVCGGVWEAASNPGCSLCLGLALPRPPPPPPATLFLNLSPSLSRSPCLISGQPGSVSPVSPRGPRGEPGPPPSQQGLFA